jgi:protein-L-isoaspartate(D-aspartate) O-methyltransferase
VDAVDAAFEAVPRADFLPKSVRRRASYDGPLDIGHGQTNSQPRTVERMLRLLDVRPGCRILDVGSGSGWTTALLAHLTGPTGSVLGVEIIPELVTIGLANLRATGFDWATIEQAQLGALGRKDQAPFDRILVSAAARTLPEELVDQLGDGGRLVIPVAGALVTVVRSGADRVVTEEGSYRFVPLLTGPAPESR